MVHITLPGTTRSRLREVLAVLELSQSSLADRVGMSQPWVSKVLTGKPIRDLKPFHELIDVLDAVLDERWEHGLIDDKPLEEARQVIRLLRGALEPPPIVSLPGDAIPASSLTYVCRDCIQDAVDWLKHTPFSMSIEGPPDSGKTTLLTAFAREARHRGFPVAYIDCKIAKETGTESVASQLTQEERLTRAAVQSACSQWDYPAPRSEDLASVSDLANAFIRVFLQQSKARSATPILIFDDLKSLSPETMEVVLRRVRALHNARATHGLAFSLVVALTWHSRRFYSYVLDSSSYAIFHPQIDVSWFTKDELRTLLLALDNKLVDYLDVLWSQYGGQPLLSHVAATQILEQGAAPEDVFASALEEGLSGKRGQFGYHIRDVLQLLESGDIRGDGLRVLTALLAGKSSEFIPYSADVRFLFDTHLVVETDAGACALASDLYRQLAAKVKWHDAVSKNVSDPSRTWATEGTNG